MKPRSNISVVGYSDEYRADFERLNLEWITGYFRIEGLDREYLQDPRGKIVEPGGEVFFVLDGGEVVGCCAVIKHSAQTYELCKMAVARDAQGRGLANLLMDAVIDFAREHNAERIFLLSNTKLEPALRLYEKYGFRTTGLGPSPDYERADIELELELD